MPLRLVFANRRFCCLNTDFGFLNSALEPPCAFPATALALPSGSWRLCRVPEFNKSQALAAKFQGLWKPRQLREQEGVNCDELPAFPSCSVSVSFSPADRVKEG